MTKRLWFELIRILQSSRPTFDQKKISNWTWISSIIKWYKHKTRRSYGPWRGRRSKYFGKHITDDSKWRAADRSSSAPISGYKLQRHTPLFCKEHTPHYSGKMTKTDRNRQWYETESRNDQKMIKIWSRYGQDMVKIWSRYGQDMVKKWSKNGQKMVKKWSRYGQGMVKIWWTHFCFGSLWRMTTSRAGSNTGKSVSKPRTSARKMSWLLRIVLLNAYPTGPWK